MVSGKAREDSVTWEASDLMAKPKFRIGRWATLKRGKRERTVRITDRIDAPDTYSVQLMVHPGDGSVGWGTFSTVKGSQLKPISPKSVKSKEDVIRDNFIMGKSKSLVGELESHINNERDFRGNKDWQKALMGRVHQWKNDWDKMINKKAQGFDTTMQEEKLLSEASQLSESYDKLLEKSLQNYTGLEGFYNLRAKGIQDFRVAVNRFNFTKDELIDDPFGFRSCALEFGEEICFRRMKDPGFCKQLGGKFDPKTKSCKIR